MYCLELLNSSLNLCQYTSLDHSSIFFFSGSGNQQRKNTSQDSAIYYDIREQTKLNDSHTEDFYSIAENHPIDSISNVLYETQSMNAYSTEVYKSN